MLSAIEISSILRRTFLVLIVPRPGGNVNRSLGRLVCHGQRGGPLCGGPLGLLRQGERGHLPGLGSGCRLGGGLGRRQGSPLHSLRGLLLNGLARTVRHGERLGTLGLGYSVNRGKVSTCCTVGSARGVSFAIGSAVCT